MMTLRVPINDENAPFYCAFDKWELIQFIPLTTFSNLTLNEVYELIDWKLSDSTVDSWTVHGDRKNPKKKNKKDYYDNEDYKHYYNFNLYSNHVNTPNVVCMIRNKVPVVVPAEQIYKRKESLYDETNQILVNAYPITEEEYQEVNDYYYLLVIILIIISVFNLIKKKDIKILFVSLIIFGSSLLLLLVESQARYTYSLLPFYCVLATIGLVESNNIINKLV
mgnify:CR=1 FL=1